MSHPGFERFGPSPLIAFVVGLEQLVWKPSTVRLLDALTQASAARGAGLMLIVDAEQPSQALRNLTSDGRVSGVLIRAQAADHGWVRELVSSVPAVMIGAHHEVRDLHVVEIENAESTASLVGSMLDAGCERLAMVTGPKGRVDAEDRIEGFRLAHVQRGLVADPALIFPGNYRREAAFELADSVIDTKPDGIFAANDEMARGLMERVAQRGLRIPDDVMIAGFDGTGDAGIASTDLATVHTPWEAIADIAIETLLGLINGMDMPMERLVDPQVSLGDTIVRRPGSPEAAGLEAPISRAVPEDPA